MRAAANFGDAMLHVAKNDVQSSAKTVQKTWDDWNSAHKGMSANAHYSAAVYHEDQGIKARKAGDLAKSGFHQNESANHMQAAREKGYGS